MGKVLRKREECSRNRRIVETHEQETLPPSLSSPSLPPSLPRRPPYLPPSTPSLSPSLVSLPPSLPPATPLRARSARDASSTAIDRVNAQRRTETTKRASHAAAPVFEANVIDRSRGGVWIQLHDEKTQTTRAFEVVIETVDNRKKKLRRKKRKEGDTGLLGADKGSSETERARSKPGRRRRKRSPRKPACTFRPSSA